MLLQCGACHYSAVEGELLGPFFLPDGDLNSLGSSARVFFVGRLQQRALRDIGL